MNWMGAGLHHIINKTGAYITNFIPALRREEPVVQFKLQHFFPSLQPDIKLPHPPPNFHRHYLPPLVLLVLGRDAQLSLGVACRVDGCNNLL
jgi:hypothetical protein